jgi:hypothetical protein
MLAPRASPDRDQMALTGFPASDAEGTLHLHAWDILLDVGAKRPLHGRPLAHSQKGKASGASRRALSNESASVKPTPCLENNFLGTLGFLKSVAAKFTDEIYLHRLEVVC